MDKALLAALIAFALGFVAFVIVLINVLKGVSRGLTKTVGSLVAVVLSAVTSLILTMVLCSPTSGAVNWLLSTVMEGADGSLSELMGIEELSTTFAYYFAMIVSPFFFTVCFCFCSIIFAIIVAILLKFVPVFKSLRAKERVLEDGEKKAKLKPRFRLAGAGVGLVCGYLVSVMVLTPIVGTLSTVTSIPYDEIMGSEEAEENDEETEYYVDEEEDDYYEDNGVDEDEEMIEFFETANGYVNIFMNAGCGPIYNLLASADFNGERIYLNKDLGVFIELFMVLDDAGNTLDGSKLNQSHVDAIRSLVEHVEASPLLQNTVAGVFSTACTNWNEGNSFMGMEKINTGDLVSPVSNELINVLSTTTYETVESDLDTMVDVFESLVNSHILDEKEYDKMLIMLGEEGGLLDQLEEVLHNNSRMDKVAEEVSMLSVRAMASHLNVDTEEYNVLVSDIATSLNKYGNMNEEDKRSNVEADLKTAFDDYGVKVEGQAFDDIVDDVMEEFDGRTDVTDAEISDYFQKHVVEELEENGTNEGGFGK